MPTDPATTAGAVALLIGAAVAGYAVGSLNPAATIARVRGVDLRGTGSGNPGATNAARTMGRGIGVLVGALDVLKGFVPAVAFASLWLPAGEVAGIAAVVGHITSPFLKGRGGKGVATALGAILGTHALWAIPVLAAFGIVVAITRRVGLASVAAAATLVPTAVLLSERWTSIALGLGIAALIVVRHRANIRAALARRSAG